MQTTRMNVRMVQYIVAGVCIGSLMFRWTENRGRQLDGESNMVVGSVVVRICG